MGLREVYVAVATLLLATSRQDCEGSTVQAAFDMGEDGGEILKLMFKKLELLASRDFNSTAQTQLQSHTELASALLQVAPVVILKGNITDSSRRFTVTFTVQASHHPDSEEEDDDDDDNDVADCWECGGAWRGSGGVFHPVVTAVEPYLMGLVELVFHGILSAVIGNFLQAAALMQDVRLV